MLIHSWDVEDTQMQHSPAPLGASSLLTETCRNPHNCEPRLSGWDTYKQPQGLQRLKSLNGGGSLLLHLLNGLS